VAMYSRQQLQRAARLTGADLVEVSRRRRPQNRLGFAYQLAFVRLVNRFPRREPFEVIDALVDFTSVQLGADAALIEQYCGRRQTRSEHQRAIVAYLRLRDFGAAEAALLEEFVFEESCRLEQATALQAAGATLRPRAST